MKSQVATGVVPTKLPDAVTKFEPGTLRGSEQLRLLCETHLAQVITDNKRLNTPLLLYIWQQ